MSGTVKVGPKGRVVIPMEARRRLGIEEGDDLCLVIRDDSIELLPRDAVIQRLRSMATGRGSAVDELIADRRADALAEESRWAR